MSLAVFNVYEPPVTSGDRLDRAERLAFIKDGFHWMAALFPIIWLPVKGLWIEFLVFLVGFGALTWGLEAVGTNSELVSVLALIVQIIIGFEATNLQGAALERRGWSLAGTISGRSREECEVRFLSNWLAEHTAGADGPSFGSPTSTRAPLSPAWLGASLGGIKDSFARGRRLART